MRCPWPAVRLARALRDGAERVEVLADDPAAPDELAAIAAQAAATIQRIDKNLGPEFLVTAGPDRNGVFTVSA